jgi:hypothetical protein
MRAEELVQAIVAGEGTAGGHGMMASGQIPLAGRDPEEVARELHRRALALLKLPDGFQGEPLV